MTSDTFEGSLSNPDPAYACFPYKRASGSSATEKPGGVIRGLMFVMALYLSSALCMATLWALWHLLR
jgi:hypothetical protein